MSRGKRQTVGEFLDSPPAVAAAAVRQEIRDLTAAAVRAAKRSGVTVTLADGSTATVSVERIFNGPTRYWIEFSDPSILPAAGRCFPTLAAAKQELTTAAFFAASHATRQERSQS